MTAPWGASQVTASERTEAIERLRRAGWLWLYLFTQSNGDRGFRGYHPRQRVIREFWQVKDVEVVLAQAATIGPTDDAESDAA